MCVAIANIQMKHLQHSMKIPETLALQHSKWNTCNIRLKQINHLEHTLETYVYSHYNMCNIPIYFCNIDIQHLQHTSESSKTLETYSFNIRFSPLFFRTTRHIVGNGRFRQASSWGRWCRIAATSCACAWWPHVAASACAAAASSGHKGGRGSDGRWSAAKEKDEHGAASHKRPALVMRREDEQRCGREIY